MLASALLDKPVDKWAKNHATGTWDKLGKAGNVTPYLLAAGAGALYAGLGGPEKATTAETALRAGAYTLITKMGLRYAVGRARPTDSLGSASFSGFSRNALKSSSPPTHTALAFALVTPFAQQYNQPWLYGLAAASAFGRVQQREHWVSDTIGGALLGYGIGTLLGDQQDQAAKRRVALSVTPSSVAATWQF